MITEKQYLEAKKIIKAYKAQLKLTENKDLFVVYWDTYEGECYWDNSGKQTLNLEEAKKYITAAEAKNFLKKTLGGWGAIKSIKA